MTYVRVKQIESRHRCDNGYPLIRLIVGNVGGTAEYFVPVQDFS